MQNLVTIRWTAAELAELDQTLHTLRRLLGNFIVLRPEQRRTLSKMGEKSEAFCRQTLSAVAANPEIVPPSINVADALGDLAAFDELRPRVQQLRQLVERAEDTTMALGSDAMSCALAGYALLKLAGRSAALKGVQRDLSTRFAKSPRTAPSPEAV